MMARPTWQFVWPAAVVCIAALSAAPAAAQSSPQPRIEISANVGAQTGAGAFTVSTEAPSNGAEKETITVDYGSKTALAVDVGGAVRIARQVWIGAQFSTAGSKSTASITAVVPHPILFNTPRTVEGTLDKVAHDEQNVHVDLMYALPVHAVDLKVMGGPTFFNLTQDFVSSLTVNETYPFDTATFGNASRKRLSKGAVGFNAGVDISRPLSSSIGVGGIVRYSRGDVKFDDPAIGRQTVKAGGVEAAAGIRIRF